MKLRAVLSYGIVGACGFFVGAVIAQTIQLRLFADSNNVSVETLVDSSFDVSKAVEQSNHSANPWKHLIDEVMTDGRTNHAQVDNGPNGFGDFTSEWYTGTDIDIEDSEE